MAASLAHNRHDGNLGRSKRACKTSRPVPGGVEPAHGLSPENHSQPGVVVKESQGVSDEFERRRSDTLGFPINIGTATVDRITHEVELKTMARTLADVKTTNEDIEMLDRIRS